MFSKQIHFMKHLPNLITLGNLFCGSVAIIYAVQENFVSAAFFVILGIVLDFFDGFFARLLKVTGELGKQLDSLADMVTSGLVPGVIMFKLMQINLKSDPNSFIHEDPVLDVALIGLFITLAACLRLAKFNLDKRQTDQFIGLPTPAMCLVVISLPLIQKYSDVEFAKDLIANNYFLIALTWVLSYLMNAEIFLFSLKFKDYSIAKNKIKYLFLIVSIILIFTLKYLAIPLLILFYIILSLFNRSSK